MPRPDPGRETGTGGALHKVYVFVWKFSTRAQLRYCVVCPQSELPISLFEMFQQETGTEKQIDVYQNR